MKHLLPLMVYLGLVLTTPAQDFSQSWEAYNHSEAELTGLQLRIERVRVEQLVLQREIADLKDSRNWYNGWYNEMLLSRKGLEFSQRTDSLAVLNKLQPDLTNNRDAALANLKSIYAGIVQNEVLSRTDKERAIVLGNWLLKKKSGTADLPDYEGFFNENFDDEQVQRLVMADLRLVITAKLSQVESLIEERHQEQELLDRLTEFHDDLNLQQESERDLGSPAGGGGFFTTQDAASFDDISTELSGNFGSGDAKRLDSEGADPSNISMGSNFNPGGSLLPDANELNDDISLLTAKQSHYQQLLERIESTLTASE